MTKDELNRAATRILAAAPDAHLQWSDYGLSLSVARHDRRQAFIVYRVPRPDIGQREVKADVSRIIAAVTGN